MFDIKKKKYFQYLNHQYCVTLTKNIQLVLFFQIFFLFSVQYYGIWNMCGWSVTYHQQKTKFNSFCNIQQCYKLWKCSFGLFNNRNISYKSKVIKVVLCKVSACVRRIIISNYIGTDAVEYKITNKDDFNLYNMINIMIYDISCVLSELRIQESTL